MRPNLLGWPAAAAAAVGVTALSGGAFDPRWGAVVGGLMAGVAAVAAARWRGPVRHSEALLLVLVGWGVVGAVVLRGSPLEAKQTVATWVCAWLLWTGVRRSPAVGRAGVLRVLVGVGCVLSLGVVAEWWTFGVPRVGGLLENPNLAAALLAPLVAAAPLALGRSLRVWAVIAGLLAGVALTGSRAGLAAAGLALVLMLPSGWARRLALTLVVVVGAGLLMWRAAAHPDPLAWHRPRIWGAVTRLVWSQPLFGVAPGGLVDAAGRARLPHDELLGRYQRRPSSAESSAAGILVQTGVVGFTLAAVAVLLWLRNLRRRGGLRAPPVAGVVAAIAVMAALHDVLQLAVVLCWWALLLGAVDGVTVVGEASRGVRPWKSASVAAAVVVGCLVLWGLAQPAVAVLVWKGTGDVGRVVRLEPWMDGPMVSRAAELLARARWSWTDAGEAAYWSERAVAVHRGSARAWAWAARVQARVATEMGGGSAADRARACWQEACRLEPHLPWYALEWAQLERSLGAGDRAIELGAVSVESEPAFVRGWLLLARLELDRGRTEAATHDLERAEEALEAGQGRHLTSYERTLLLAPPWQLASLREGLQ